MVDNLTYTIFYSTRLLVPESRIVLLHDVPHRNYGLGDRGGIVRGSDPLIGGTPWGTSLTGGTLGGSSSDRGNLFSYDFLSKIKIWSGRWRNRTPLDVWYPHRAYHGSGRLSSVVPRPQMMDLKQFLVVPWCSNVDSPTREPLRAKRGLQFSRFQCFPNSFKDS